MTYLRQPHLHCQCVDYMLHAAWFDLRVETGDLVCVCVCVLSCKQTHAVKCWLDLRKDKNVMDGSGDYMGRSTAYKRRAETSQTSSLVILTELMGFKRGKLERCLFVHESNETRVVSHVDDPLICAKPATLEKFWMQITKLVVIKRGEALNASRSCNLPGIRVPKCTRW